MRLFSPHVGHHGKLRELDTPCASLQSSTWAFTTASPRGKKRELIPHCASVRTPMIHVYSQVERTWSSTRCTHPECEQEETAWAAVVNAGGGVRLAAPAGALSQHRGPTPPQKKKRKRASHSHLCPFIVHDAQSDEIFHVRRGLTATTIMCPCLFSATWTCPGFTDVHKFRCFGVFQFLECVRCFGAVFVSLAKFPCKGLRFESQDNSARQLST